MIGNINIGQFGDSAAEFSPCRSSILSGEVSGNSSIDDYNVTDGSLADGSVSDNSCESQESQSFQPASSDTSHIEMDTSLTFNEYSYIQPHSFSELEVSYVAPAYSPVNDEHSFPEQPVTADDHVAHANEHIVGPVNTNEGTTIGAVVTMQPNNWSGFKITIDNVDKNFRPSFQRTHHQTKSLHCVHMYAVKDRIDLSLFSIALPQDVAITPEDILPSLSDLCSIKEHFKVLVSRYVGIIQ